jgi:8-oxo-dGTP diphosphatase
MKYGTMSYLFVEGRVLMIEKFKRENDPNSGLFTLPGGKLEDSEKKNPEGRLESAIRETEDETGLILIKPRLRGVILFDNSKRIFKNWPNPEDFLVHIFSAKEYTGELKDKCDEGIPRWIIEFLIPTLPTNEGDAKMYEWLEDPRYFIGVINHKGKKLDEENTFVDYFG